MPRLNFLWLVIAGVLTVNPARAEQTSDVVQRLESELRNYVGQHTGWKPENFEVRVVAYDSPSVGRRCKRRDPVLHQNADQVV
jgi:hypothetical protein